ncbi:MAG: PLP-dependent aminotransferase family protein [Bacteroidota bacterium]
MLPFASLLHLSDDSKLPVYLRISNAIIEQISQGTIRPGTRLPSSRALADMLQVHRKTIVAAYDELYAQGWIESRSTKGTFVNDQLPTVDPVPLTPSTPDQELTSSGLSQEVLLPLRFDDGFPDTRLAPLASLGKEYSSLLKDRKFTRYLTYTSNFMGDQKLREQIALHLRDTRGIYVSTDHILISRGSIMAFYLILVSHLSPGAGVLVGAPGYQTFNKIVSRTGGRLLEIPVDESGLQVDHIAELCETELVEFVYVVPHHHHPTTVTLSPERRLRLLELSKQYGFRIIEDDYDFDFHYESGAILPLTSLNHQGKVIYVGSFSKTIAPSLRLAFVVASPEILGDLAELRRLIDRSGDPVLERAVARLLEYGEIRRHLNKAVKVYRSRRDLLCRLLGEELSDYISFQVPEGGMAIWAKYAQHLNIESISQAAAKEGLYVPLPQAYPSPSGRHVRLGYSSMNEEEIRQAFGMLKALILTH